MKINIPEPCSEDWSKMTPTEKGAFCQKCAIDVVDFTDKSPFEIKNILKREMGSSGKACGRIRKSQLVEFNAFNFQPKSDRESFQFLWTFSLIAVFGLSLFSCQSTLSRELVEQINVSGTEFIEAKTSTPTSEEEELIEPIEISQDSVAHFINNEELKIEILSGAIAIEPEIECIIWSSIFVAGNMTLGVIMPEPETQEPIEWQSRGIITIPPEPISYTSPVYHHPREPTSNTPSDIIQTGNDREFDALIHPLPIEESSRLYIMAHQSLDLNISLLMGTEITINHQFKLTRGNHNIDLSLNKLNVGTYILELSSKGTEQSFYFNKI